MSSDVWIYGAGALGRKACQCARSSGWSVRGFIDDSAANASILGVSVVSREQAGSVKLSGQLFVAIGLGHVRKRILHEMADDGWSVVTLVHSNAWVAPDVHLGRGVLVAACAAIESGSVVGEGALIDVGAVVDHDCHIGSYMHVKPGAVVSAGSREV